MTVQEIADALGVSHQRVTQIEQNALKKIQKQLKNHALTYEDLFKCLKYS